MTIAKPSVPRGTRDFSPAEMRKRKYIFSAIENTFIRYGYQPLETPAMEYLTTLLGKYGDEGDKLIFKILNSGDFLEGIPSADLTGVNSQKLSQQICERGLRYDLTVPFARFVVQNRNEIQFPFKRYQIQPVWRADKPQKGRYREFYQCDVDVIGSNSLLNELELILIADEIFDLLGMKVEIRINHRKILFGIAEVMGAPDQANTIIIAMDKIDKIGLEKVNEELLARGIGDDAVRKIQPFFRLGGNNTDKVNRLRELLGGSVTGLQGVDQMNQLLSYSTGTNLRVDVNLDLTLARGLDYYTGTIIEVISRDMQIGSVCGGGRYDDLTGIFGLQGISGVGISFGADRIYDVLQQANLFPVQEINNTRILFVNFGEREVACCLPMLKKIREKGIPAELYPDPDKMKKQFGYADANKIPYVAIIGTNEMTRGIITLRNMQTGSQEEMTLDDLIRVISASVP